MIKGEIFFAEAPLDFIHFFAVASKLAVQHKRKTPIRVSFSFGCNEAHLRCMKNEAGRASYEASLRLTERLLCASLHGGRAAAS